MSETKEEHNAPIWRAIHALEKKLAEYEKLLELIKKYKTKVIKLNLSLKDDIISPVGAYDLAGNIEWRGTNYTTANDQVWTGIKGKLSDYEGDVSELLGDITSAINKLIGMISDVKQQIRNLKSRLW